MVSSVHFYFLFRINGKKEYLDENDFYQCYGKFLKVTWLQLRSKFSLKLRGKLAIAFERYFTVEDFTDMDQHMC